VRARSSGLTAADVDSALTHTRSLLVTWLCRGTLHLVRSEDYPWLHALTAPGLLSANARRLRQEGVSPTAVERGVTAVRGALAEEGPLSRAELRERIALAGVPTAGQALVHLLMLASLRGLVVRGPMVGREHAYVLVDDWLGPKRPVDREQALAELARRYLQGHGPADDRDLAKWSGLPLRDARAGLSAIAGELVQRDGGLLGLRGQMAAAELPRPRLLGPFEPLLLGWRSRDPIVEAGERLFTSNGIVRPVVLVRGRAVGTWALRGEQLELEPFRSISSLDRASLETDGKAVLEYLRGSGADAHPAHGSTRVA
jgi:Winged helix DNA-binding domain